MYAYWPADLDSGVWPSFFLFLFFSSRLRRVLVAFAVRFRSIGMSATTPLIGSSFPFSPAAIVLSLSFLRRWQVKRPIRAGQRGRAHHSPRIPNSIEKERYLIERPLLRAMGISCSAEEKSIAIEISSAFAIDLSAKLDVWFMRARDCPPPANWFLELKSRKFPYFLISRFSKFYFILFNIIII